MRSFRPDGIRQVPQRPLEHLTVEEDERVQCLVLRRGGDVPITGKMAQELHHVRCTHSRGVSCIVEQNETLDPVAVGVGGAVAEMLKRTLCPHLIEQFWGLHRPSCRIRMILNVSTN